MKKYNFIGTGLTDIGQKRSTNQDSIYFSNKDYFYLVADGMGGHNGGDIASQMACQLIPNYLSSSKNNTYKSKIIEAVQNSNNDILKRGQQDTKLEGMGTTTVGFQYDKEKNILTVFNVGDSRAYLIDDNQIFQLSKDHSLIQEKINLGIYDRKIALKDPHKNVLIKTVGFDPNVEVDTFEYSPQINQFFLLCSDGLHGLLEDSDILKHVQKFHNINDDANLLENSEDKLKIICQKLIDRANSLGGNDNISVILAQVTEDFSA